MTPKRLALVGLLATSVVHGLVSAWATVQPGQPMVAVALGVEAFAILLFPFMWLAADRRERGLPRSYPFDVAVVSVFALAVPAYLWRSRPRGRRLRALAGMAAIGFASLCTSIAGMAAGLIGFAMLSASPQA